MPKFWTWQDSQYASLAQRSDYKTIFLDRILSITWVLNVPVFWIWQCFEYGRVVNLDDLPRVLNVPQYDWICLNRSWICLIMSKFTIIDRVLNISHKIHSARSFDKLMSTYWEMSLFRTLLKIVDEHFGKSFDSFNCFCKTIHLKSLRGLLVCVGF